MRKTLWAVLPALLLGACTPDAGSGAATGRWPVSVSDGRSWRAISDYPPGWTRSADDPERLTQVWVRAQAGNLPTAIVTAQQLARSGAQTAKF
jgi:hypothetical protein